MILKKLPPKRRNTATARITFRKKIPTRLSIDPIFPAVTEAEKQKWEASLNESFPFNELETIASNSIQATVQRLAPVARVEISFSSQSPKGHVPR